MIGRREHDDRRHLGVDLQDYVVVLGRIAQLDDNRGGAAIGPSEDGQTAFEVALRICDTIHAVWEHVCLHGLLGR